MPSASRLEHGFEQECDALRKVFSRINLEARYDRLNEIFNFCEEHWLVYAQQCAPAPIRYVLIAEAPPWTESGRPHYALDPESSSRSIMRALVGAFPEARLVSGEARLVALAAQGFLLMDSIPLAMEYKGKRSTSKYRKLVRMTTQSYLQAKINRSGLTWAPGLKIAFAVELNAQAILDATRILRFGSSEYGLSEDQIGADDSSHYPSAERLRTIFGVGSGRAT